MLVDSQVQCACGVGQSAPCGGRSRSAACISQALRNAAAEVGLLLVDSRALYMKVMHWATHTAHIPSPTTHQIRPMIHPV